MDINSMLGVVIGLCSLYWIVATTASYCVEALASWRNVRARGLEMFIGEMIGGAQVKATLGWWQRLVARAPPAQERPNATAAAPGPGDLNVMDHPLIRRLYKPARGLNGDDTTPSYVPADLFVKALLDRVTQLYGTLLVGADAVRSLHAQLPPAVATTLEAPLQSVLARLDATAAWRLVVDAIVLAANPGVTPTQALTDAANACTGPARAALLVLADRLNGQNWAQASAQFGPGHWPAMMAALGQRALGVDDLRALVDSGRLPDALAAALRPIIDAANHDIDALRKGIEGWYDSVMDRATGWFRRYSQVWLAVIALALAVIFNLDSVYVAQRLWADPQAREAAVQLGQRIVREGDDAPRLVQAFAFRQAYDGGDWQARLAAGGDRLAAADSIALRTQPLILRSAALIGPMLALQAEAMRALRECKDDVVECEAARRVDWAPGKEDRLHAFVGALCRVQLARASSNAADREWAAAHSDIEVGSVKPPDGHDPCANARALATGTDRPLDTLNKLWSADSIVWDADLGKQAWAIRKDAVRAPMSAPVAASPLVQKDVAAFDASMRNAVAKAREDAGVIDAVTARLDELGSGRAAIARWALRCKTDGPGASAWAALVSIFGWCITAFMASLGAPLWFDLLNKLTNRRIAGPKPASAASVEG